MGLRKSSGANRERGDRPLPTFSRSTYPQQLSLSCKESSDDKESRTPPDFVVVAKWEQSHSLELQDQPPCNLVSGFIRF